MTAAGWRYRTRAGAPRPRVCLHVGQSVDGKLGAPGQGRRATGGPADVAQIDRYRAWADAVLVGATTVRATDVPLHLRDAAACARRVRRGRPAQPRAIVLSGSGRVPPGARALLGPPPRGRGDADAATAAEPTADPGARLRPLVVVSAAAEAEAIARLAAVAEVWRLPYPPNAAEAEAGQALTAEALEALLVRLYATGVRRLLVEGGSATAWSFAAAGALDDVALTLAPRLFGGRTAPTALGGAGFAFAAGPHLRLRQLRRRGDHLYLRYAVQPAGGADAVSP